MEIKINQETRITYPVEDAYPGSCELIATAKAGEDITNEISQIPDLETEIYNKMGILDDGERGTFDYKGCRFYTKGAGEIIYLEGDLSSLFAPYIDELEL